MKEQDPKSKEQTPKLRMPPEFPQLDAATEKDGCFDLPQRNSPEGVALEKALDAFWKAKEDGRIPQYPDIKPPGW